MPRSSHKGPYLILRRARKVGNRTVARAVYIIRDGKKHVATGCFAGEAEEAHRKLAEYIQSKYEPTRRERELEEIRVADVLSIYLDDRSDHQSNLEQLAARIGRLNEFWGDKSLAEVTSATCREYARWRGNKGGARRDLEDLRAAIRHHAKENLHRASVNIWLPEKGMPRDRWLTESEAIQLLRTCWRYRETQTVHRGPRKGQKVTTDKMPHTLRHLARFILIGLYTGTRAGAIAAASPYPMEGHAYVDLERGLFYRLAIGKRGTNKRQPPVPLPPKLLAHMRRWQRLGLFNTHFVEWHGKPVKSVKTAFNRAVKLAGLSGKVTPHTLRHTAATWAMHRRVPLWEAAGYLGMSVEMLESTYGHHHPDHYGQAVNAMNRGQAENGKNSSRKQRGDVKVVEKVVEAHEPQCDPTQPIDIVGGPGRTRTSNQTVMSGRL